MMLKKLFISSISFLIDSLRPLLGPSCCCIYKISCREYAKSTLQQKPFIFAIPLIIIRLISCNPITALFLKFKKNSL